jgi:hypothetical protein
MSIQHIFQSGGRYDELVLAVGVALSWDGGLFSSVAGV